MWAAGGRTRFGAARPLSRGTMPVLAGLGQRGVQAAWIDRGNVRASIWTPSRGFDRPQTVGRGAAEVQLAVSDHDIFIAWRTARSGRNGVAGGGDVLVAGRSLSTHGFSRPRTVFRGYARDLRLDENHAGRAALAFGVVTSRGAGGTPLAEDGEMSLREPGRPFGPPVQLPSSTPPGDAPRVAVDDAGTATATWLSAGSAASSRQDVVFTQGTPGGSFGTPTIVGEAAGNRPPLVAAANQMTVVAWDNGAQYSELLLGNDNPPVLPGNPFRRAVGKRHP
ncbi:MAG: hypothetical protein JWO74_3460 [Solirubrobacterales bacterium]|nr:hypothetical protein [Solirubrobacterales bacterium]